MTLWSKELILKRLIITGKRILNWFPESYRDDWEHVGEGHVGYEDEENATDVLHCNFVGDVHLVVDGPEYEGEKLKKVS